VIANLLRCILCGSVRGFLTFCGSERMYAIPFQLAPTTVPTLPEKPPKIPFLIVPIMKKNEVYKLFYLDLVRLWYGFALIQIQKYIVLITFLYFGVLCFCLL
jgi:hypothetical protein